MQTCCKSHFVPKHKHLPLPHIPSPNKMLSPFQDYFFIIRTLDDIPQAQALSHPNIFLIFDIITTNDIPLIPPLPHTINLKIMGLTHMDDLDNLNLQNIFPNVKAVNTNRFIPTAFPPTLTKITAENYINPYPRKVLWEDKITYLDIKNSVGEDFPNIRFYKSRNASDGYVLSAAVVNVDYFSVSRRANITFKNLETLYTVDKGDGLPNMSSMPKLKNLKADKVSGISNTIKSLTTKNLLAPIPNTLEKLWYKESTRPPDVSNLKALYYEQINIVPTNIQELGCILWSWNADLTMFKHLNRLCLDLPMENMKKYTLPKLPKNVKCLHLYLQGANNDLIVTSWPEKLEYLIVEGRGKNNVYSPGRLHRGLRYFKYVSVDGEFIYDGKYPESLETVVIYQITQSVNMPGLKELFVFKLLLEGWDEMCYPKLKMLYVDGTLRSHLGLNIPDSVEYFMSRDNGVNLTYGNNMKIIVVRDRGHNLVPMNPNVVIMREDIIGFGRDLNHEIMRMFDIGGDPIWEDFRKFEFEYWDGVIGGVGYEDEKWMWIEGRDGDDNGNEMDVDV